ncbi:MAG: hypothetical protein KDB92_10285 [Chitinophagaceae bacterium]|nr:hypothetical protein [Chitinophagaceae bacterium]MCB0741407.1 hypothetical protein [Chitinophagaceae bacterium]
MTRSAGILFILVTVFISTVCSVTADIQGASMGGINNYFWPPFIGLISIFLFLFFAWLIKDINANVYLVVLFCSYNIYVGVSFYLGNGAWPMTMF